MENGSMRHDARAVGSVPQSRSGGKAGGARRQISGGGARAVSNAREIEDECTRILGILACEQLANLAGFRGVFDVESGMPTREGQLLRARLRRVSQFETGVDGYVCWRLAWELFTGTRMRGDVLVAVIGDLSLSNLSDHAMRAVANILGSIEHDPGAGVPL